MSGKGYFTDQLYAKLAARGMVTDWQIEQLAVAVVNVMNNPHHFSEVLAPPAPATPSHAWEGMDLTNLTNHQLIHEMLKRGFAVMKVPESGKPLALDPTPRCGA